MAPDEPLSDQEVDRLIEALKTVDDPDYGQLVDPELDDD